MAELLENIGHNIRRLREEKGWNQTELGFHADTSPSIISLIENGKRNPSTATLAKIAGALGVEVVELFPKADRRSSLEPSLLNGLEEERRFSVLGQAVIAAGDKWAMAVRQPDMDFQKVAGLVEACFDLMGFAYDQVDGETEWNSLTVTERSEIMAAMARLLETGNRGVKRMEESVNAEESKMDIERRREQIKEWTRRISA